MPRFAANLSLMFQEWAFLDRFAAAADAGFTAVECQFPYDHSADHVAARLEGNGLVMVLLNMPAGDWSAGDRGLAALPGRSGEFGDGVRRGIDYAGIVGASLLHMLAGVAEPCDSLARNAYRGALDYCAPRLLEAGLTLLIEPINNRDIPGYFLNDFVAAEQFIAACGFSNLKLQFDIYHRQIMRGDVTCALERLMPVIGHVQVASVPHRAEPGSGELDDAHVFRVLDRLGYGGHVGAEYAPARGTLEGLGWFEPYKGGEHNDQNPAGPTSREGH